MGDVVRKKPAHLGDEKAAWIQKQLALAPPLSDAQRRDLAVLAGMCRRTSTPRIRAGDRPSLGGMLSPSKYD